ncbi:MAG: hypothetical protein LRY27_03590 [Chitinophagales bacterium]|nr:hypothetical protein [Chitinophagales bacterium]
MLTLFTNIKQLIQVREHSEKPIYGLDMKNLPVIENAWLLIDKGIIVDYGKMDTCPQVEAEIIDATGKLILPAWVDSHTHIVFAASREEEFVMKIKGKTYEEIAAAGGGILNSARKLRLQTENELYLSASKRLEQLMALGTGAIEIKSGYGLSVESELKMLRVIKRLKENYPIPIKANLLAAHALPPEFKDNRKAYIDLIIKEIIPQAAKENVANFIDVFCVKRLFYSPRNRPDFKSRNFQRIKS